MEGTKLPRTGSGLPLVEIVAVGAAVTAGGYATYRAGHQGAPGKHRPSLPAD